MPKLEDLADVLAGAIKAVEAFDLALADAPQAPLVGKLFARLDAVHSSAAEGSTTTFTDLLEYESALRSAPDPEDARLVSAAVTAFEATVAGRERDPVRIAAAIQRRMYEGVRALAAHQAGQLKRLVNGTRDDAVPGGRFYFTAPAAVADAMQEWRGFTAASDPKVPELVRQGLSHWMFEHIHPFQDGNGRVGRLLVPLMLACKSATRAACAYVGEAVHEDRNLYIEALKGARQTGDLTSWARLFLGFVARSANANLMRVGLLRAIETRWKRETASLRADSMVHRLVSFALTRPAFTIADALADIGGTFASVNKAAVSLVDRDILTVTAGRRDRLFRAPDVLAIFDRRHPRPRPQRGAKPPRSISRDVERARWTKDS